MQANVVSRRAKQLCHLCLCELDSLTLKPNLYCLITRFEDDDAIHEVGLRNSSSRDRQASNLVSKRRLSDSYRSVMGARATMLGSG